MFEGLKDCADHYNNAQIMCSENSTRFGKMQNAESGAMLELGYWADMFFYFNVFITCTLTGPATGLLFFFIPGIYSQKLQAFGKSKKGKLVGW